MGLGVLCGQTAAGTTTDHKRSIGRKTAQSGRAKSVASVSAGRQATAKSGAATKSSHVTSKSAGANRASATASSKAGGAKKASANSKSGKRGANKSVGGRQRGQMAPTPERITEIQQALAKNGALSGEPSGKWDDSTTEAMRKFQAARGLNATGKLDAPTLNQLGLGASTAGIAAPAVKTSSTAQPADIQQ
jgi:hypothetical protein